MFSRSKFRFPVKFGSGQMSEYNSKKVIRVKKKKKKLLLIAETVLFSKVGLKTASDILHIYDKLSVPN